MKPLTRLERERARAVSLVFSDIDDTLTTEGLLEADAFSSIWKLSQAGVSVVPVTGRPAGWCDHIARMWPVAGVIGENGALYYRYDASKKRMIRRYVLDEPARRANAKRLAALEKKILKTVRGAKVSADQPFRLFDLAIDFKEDLPKRLPDRSIDRIVALFEGAGATAKVSSIHVNGWFGTYDKLSMMERFAKDVLRFSLSSAAGKRRSLFVGDSPNDEPAFGAFDLSVGVANVRDFSDRMTHLPAYVAKSRGGAGFSELARRLLRARAA